MEVTSTNAYVRSYNFTGTLPNEEVYCVISDLFDVMYRKHRSNILEKHTIWCTHADKIQLKQLFQEVEEIGNMIAASPFTLENKR